LFVVWFSFPHTTCTTSPLGLNIDSLCASKFPSIKSRSLTVLGPGPSKLQRSQQAHPLPQYLSPPRLLNRHSCLQRGQRGVHSRNHLLVSNLMLNSEKYVRYCSEEVVLHLVK
jgi:hypothetical protein